VIRLVLDIRGFECLTVAGSPSAVQLKSVMVVRSLLSCFIHGSEGHQAGQPPPLKRCSVCGRLETRLMTR